jgi:hypothetical protein
MKIKNNDNEQFGVPNGPFKLLHKILYFNLGFCRTSQYTKMKNL